MSFAAVSASGLQTLIPGTHHRNVSVLLTRPSAWFCPLQENVELLECSAVSYAAQEAGKSMMGVCGLQIWPEIHIKWKLKLVKWNKEKSWRFDSVQVLKKYTWNGDSDDVPASHNCGTVQSRNVGKTNLSPAFSTLFGSQRYWFFMAVPNVTD